MRHQIENPRRHRKTVAKVPTITDRQFEISIARIAIMIYTKKQDVLPKVQHTYYIGIHHLFHAEIVSKMETGKSGRETVALATSP